MPTIDPDEADEIAAEQRRVRGSAAQRMRAAWSRLTPARRRFVAVGVALTVLGTIVACWWGVSSTLGKPYWRDLAYDVVDPSTTRVRFEVTRPADMNLVCTVEAQETAHAVVGRVQVPVPAGAPDTVRVTATVRTTSLAVYGSVKRCEAG